ncbi:MAG TPA: LysR substrate-binding domain-containing protein [Xanthobacteraceae bacterium]|jgi:LysR family hydrogen peroxide-inducible transcriptional activator|nr:LysR substrate-binding domain-containing protein [Xanthobacteraceae bacterium]
MVTLRQLRYLTALVRHGHFGRAAESCAVTQPALSMQIRELERELKVDLLERRSGEFALTETGREIAQRAGRVLTDVQDLVDFARHKDQVLTGALRLGIIPSLAPYLLPRILPRLQKKYPSLRLEVRETMTKQLVGELERGDLDVMMAALPIEHPAFETLQLFRDPFLLAMSSQSAPQIQRISVDAIDPRRLILLEEGHCLRDQALAFCSATSDSAPTSLGATSLATVMQMVANGYGITLVPEVAAQAEVHDPRIKLVRFRNPEPARSVGLVWRASSPRKEDFKALGRIVSESLKKPGAAKSKRPAA